LVQEWSSDTQETPADWAKRLFVRYFDLEVKKQLLGKEDDKKRWKGRNPPRPLDINSLVGSTASGSDSGKRQLLSVVEHQVPSNVDSAKAFLKAVETLVCDRSHLIGQMTFDKDDEVVSTCYFSYPDLKNFGCPFQLSMEFVAAAANLRMAVYSIPMQTPFQIKVAHDFMTF